MSRTTICAIAAAGAALVAGCGSSTHFADRNRPPTPVDLTVYVNDARVSVSPAHVGAGPVIFYVTNQASRTENVVINDGGGQALASTGPINPQQTAQVQVDFRTGRYTIATEKAGLTDASLAATHGIRPATLHIGAARANADNALLQP